MRPITFVAATLAVAIATISVEPAFASAKERKLLRKHDCTKCHAVSKKKDGPSLKEIADKYRDDPEAMEKLYTHVTNEQTVEVDGKEETHKPIDIDDKEQVEDIVRYILSN